MDEASVALRSDPRVFDLLGETPTIGGVFSQAKKKERGKSAYAPM